MYHLDKQSYEQTLRTLKYLVMEAKKNLIQIFKN
jgi:hypothetical protein